jgi:hypothetical protein
MPIEFLTDAQIAGTVFSLDDTEKNPDYDR